MKRASPVLVLLLKALVSLGFLSFLLSRIDITQLLGVLASAHLSYLVAALTGYPLGQIISSVRGALPAQPIVYHGRSRQPDWRSCLYADKKSETFGYRL